LPVTETPVVGEVLLAPYDGNYYRGVVKTVDPSDKTVVLEFIDYGDRARCPFESVRLPTEEIMKVRDDKGQQTTLTDFQYFNFYPNPEIAFPCSSLYLD